MSDEYYLLCKQAKRFVHIGWVNLAGVSQKEKETNLFLKEVMKNLWSDLRLVFDQEIYDILEGSADPYYELDKEGEWSTEMWDSCREEMSEDAL